MKDQMRLDDACEERDVLKVAEHGEIGRDGESGADRASMPDRLIGDDLGNIEIRDGGCQQNEEVADAPPRVERQRRKPKPCFRYRRRCVDFRQVIAAKNNGQKCEAEGPGIEEHV